MLFLFSFLIKQQFAFHKFLTFSLEYPHLALDGGKYGTDFYKKIAQQSKQYLKKGAFLFFEIGYQQAEAVCSILNQNGFDNIVVCKDLAGLDRVVLGQYMK